MKKPTSFSMVALKTFARRTPPASSMTNPTTTISAPTVPDA